MLEIITLILVQLATLTGTPATTQSPTPPPTEVEPTTTTTPPPPPPPPIGNEGWGNG